MEECKIGFPEDGESENILGHILTKDPLLWLGSSSMPFTMTSVEAVALPLLHNLVYFKHKLSELDQGIRIGKKVEISKLSYPKKSSTVEQMKE